MLSGSQSKKWKNETIVGAVISGAWLLVFAGLLIYRFDSAKSLELNAWGDFLAGFSAPLALLWLVIGYIQQGRELSLNTDALLSQQQELANQVQETARVAQNAERQALASEQLAAAMMDEARVARLKEVAASMPLIKGKGGQNGFDKLICEIGNAGAPIKDVSIKAEGLRAVISPVNQFLPGDNGNMSFFKDGGSIVYPFQFEVSFTTLLDEAHTKKYEMYEPTQFKEVVW